MTRSLEHGIIKGGLRNVLMSSMGERVGKDVFVGVTGHRVLSQPDRVRAGVATAIEEIRELFPGRTITLLSSLAEGSDRLIVQQLLMQSGTRLIVPLPMPEASYAQDFCTNESKQEFRQLLQQATKIVELTPMPTRNQSYECASKYILDHSQILLAVWDGQPEQGPGGTGGIVAEARSRGLPIAWIHAGNRAPGTMQPTTVGSEEGQVTFERFKTPINEQDNAASLIHKALTRRDGRAIALQKKRLTFALITIALSPVAVFLLATQVIVFPDGGLKAISLIAIELGLLAWALAISFLNIGRSHKEWIHERLRAEILRRESFLLLSHVGPYLNTSPSALANRVQERLLHIESDVRDPLALLLTRDGGISWQENLENANCGQNISTLTDLPSRIEQYINQRVARQRAWFSSKSHAHHSLSSFLDGSAKAVLILALIVAAFHLGLLVAAPQKIETLSFHRILVLMAISLPAVGGAMVGLHAVLGSERLNRSYRYHAEVLEDIETSLVRLLNELSTSGPLPLQDIQFRFMRLVLRVEEVLAHELQQWWLVMHPNPHPGP